MPFVNKKINMIINNPKERISFAASRPVTTTTTTASTSLDKLNSSMIDRIQNVKKSGCRSCGGAK